MPILKDGKFRAQFPSNNRYLEEVEALTVKICTESGFDESATDDLSIAITELFNNAINHGNRGNSNKMVTISYHYHDKQLQITVQDEGTGFNPESIKDPLAPENLLAESGRGLYLVKMLMDDIDFNITDTGTEIVITKYQ